jgi:CheY-like chemotaxis protein
MDGFEFLEALRARPGGESIPVIVVTAADLNEEDHRRLNGGIERILQKGVTDRDALLKELSGLVRHYVGGQAKP